MIDDTDLIEVKSSNIKAVAYDMKEKKLLVVFIGGGRYQYNDIPPALYSDFILSESKGKFFSMNIKNQFKFEKVEVLKEHGRKS